jgi:uncharacterized protein YqgV (UPF0045/DUF77 family)
MNVSVELSYYPLNEEFIPHIVEFIENLRKHHDIEARTNGMSTQVFGEYNTVMKVLVDEIRQACALPHSVFVMKIVNADLR